LAFSTASSASTSSSTFNTPGNKSIALSNIFGVLFVDESTTICAFTSSVNFSFLSS
jgi:hypothetical protein